MSGGHRGEGWSGVFSDLETGDVDPLPSTDSDPTDADPTDPNLERPPSLAPAAFPRDPGGPDADAPAPPATFSEETLMKTLEPEAPGLASESPAGFWREYRELVLTAVAGLILLGAAVIWGRAGPSPADAGSEASNRRAAPAQPPAGREPASEPSAPKRPVERGRPAPSGRAGASPATEPKRSEAKLPMLTVVTRPSGALVEIDGVVYGRTPLIMQAPPDRRSFDVELRLDDHRPWSGVVTKDESGHFSVNAELVPWTRSAPRD